MSDENLFYEAGEEETGSEESLEKALYELWDRMKKAVSVIQTLQQDNADLKKQAAELESRIAELEESVENKERVIDNLQSDGNGGNLDGAERVSYFSDEERVELERKIDQLIERINTHLG